MKTLKMILLAPFVGTFAILLFITLLFLGIFLFVLGLIDEIFIK